IARRAMDKLDRPCAFVAAASRGRLAVRDPALDARHSTPGTLEEGHMSTVAEQLRQAREAQKLTLSQVGEVTKIRTDHLRALEEGQFQAFPAAVYVRGSVRTYATLLKLDVPQVMAALEAELGQRKEFSEAIPIDQSRGVLDFVMLQLSKLDWRK